MCFFLVFRFEWTRLSDLVTVSWLWLHNQLLASGDVEHDIQSCSDEICIQYVVPYFCNKHASLILLRIRNFTKLLIQEVDPSASVKIQYSSTYVLA